MSDYGRIDGRELDRYITGNYLTLEAQLAKLEGRVHGD